MTRADFTRASVTDPRQLNSIPIQFLLSAPKQVLTSKKILVWIRIRTRISSFMRWRSNQLSYPDKTLDQARILLLLDPHYSPDKQKCNLSVMEGTPMLALF